MPSPSPKCRSERAGWFVTFGFGQPLQGCFAWIPDAHTAAQAQEKLILVYGSRWAFLYGAEEYDVAIAPYPVREVEFGTPND
jgi:hypothetical protein